MMWAGPVLEKRWIDRRVYRENWHEQQRRRQSKSPSWSGPLIDHFEIEGASLDDDTYVAVYWASGYLVGRPDVG